MTLPMAGEPIEADDWADVFPLGRGAPTPYTPAWTSSGTAPAIGNGALAGQYWRVGRWIFYRATLLIGSTSTIGTGTYYLSLPVTADATWAAGLTPTGRGTLVDASVGTRANRDAVFWDAGRILFISEAGAAAGATVPWTWAQGDLAIAAGSYPAAA